MAGNVAHVGRSYQLDDNHIDHRIESIQGPLDAFDDGAIRIEPVYRVTKNKGIVDSLIGILQRLVEPPKSPGPLVGPFHFPGIGDKVYIRLLESVQPDNLLIRLISHLPPEEIELLENNAHSPGDTGHSRIPTIAHDLSSRLKIPTVGHDLSSHPEISSVGHDPSTHPELLSLGHESLPLSADTFGNLQNQHDSVPDTLLSSTNNAIQISKSPSASNPATTTRNRPKLPYILGTYSVNLKHGEPATVKRVARHRNRYQPPYLDSGSHSKSTERKNISRDGQLLSADSLQDTYEIPYQVQSASNKFTKPSPLIINVQAPSNATNVSSEAQEPILPLKNSITNLLRNKHGESFVDGPRYSLDFTSKKMSYLNLDGSVITPGEDQDNDEGFRPTVTIPPLPKVARSIVGLKTTHSKANGTDEPSAKKETSDRVAAKQQTVECLECPREKNGKKNNKPHESSINNSTRTAAQATVKPASANLPVKSRQPLHLRGTANRREIRPNWETSEFVAVFPFNYVSFYLLIVYEA